MEQDVELLTELMQAMTNDVAELKTMVARPAQPATPVDVRPALEKVAQALQGLQQRIDKLAGQPAPAAVPADLSGQLDALRRELRQRPEYRLSQYVRYGGYAFGVMVLLLVGVSWLALDWKQELDQYRPAYEQANWRLRYLQQAEPAYYGQLEGQFARDAAGMQQWTVAQEQADRQRDLARQAQEQAKAMNAQADQLEGKTKGKKKPNR